MVIRGYRDHGVVHGVERRAAARAGGKSENTFRLIHGLGFDRACSDAPRARALADCGSGDERQRLARQDIKGKDGTLNSFIIGGGA